MAVAFLLTFLAVPAAAVNANVTSKGSFSDPVGPGSGSVFICGPDPRCSSGPVSQIRWGQSIGSGTSGLGFQGTSTVVSNENPFSAGTLVHFNNPTTGNQIDGVLLTVAVDVATAGGSFGLSVPVSLEIDETPNVGPCPYPSTTPCSDAITIVSLGEDLDSTEVLGNTSFTLTVLGFQNSGGQLVTQFISQEGSTTNVGLFATLEQNNRPVANAGTDQTVEQTGTLTSVTLDGSGSSDPDGDALTYTWTGGGLSGSVLGASPTVQLPAGSHTMTLTVGDGELTAADTVQVTVQDTTDPTIAGSRTPAANANGWNNTDVTVGFECEDGGSGIAGCSGPTTLDTDGAGQSVTGTATDNAGNTAQSTVGGINIDKTAPAIVFGGNAGTYTLDQTVVITCTATDALSGIDSSDCPTVNSPATTFGAGTHTLTATASDRAGNATEVSTSFEIVATYDSLCALVEEYVDHQGVANSLCAKLRAAEAADGRGQPEAAAQSLDAFKKEVAAQSGKSMTAQEAATLTLLANQL